MVTGNNKWHIGIIGRARILRKGREEKGITNELQWKRGRIREKEGKNWNKAEKSSLGLFDRKYCKTVIEMGKIPSEQNASFFSISTKIPATKVTNILTRKIIFNSPESCHRISFPVIFWQMLPPWVAQQKPITIFYSDLTKWNHTTRTQTMLGKKVPNPAHTEMSKLFGNMLDLSSTM